MNQRKPVNRATSRRRPVTGAVSRPTRTVAGVRAVRNPSGPRSPESVERAEDGEAGIGSRLLSRGRRDRADARSARTDSDGVRGRGASWRVTAGCLVGAILLGGFAAFAAARPGVEDTDRAFVDSAATEEVRAAAEHALRTIYAYDIAKIDGYEAAVRSVVTGTMLTDLDKFSATTLEAIRQAQTSADAKADPIAVTLLTEDRAELLVNLVVSATKGGTAQQSVAGPVVLRMSKIDGHWLASEIVDR